MERLYRITGQKFCAGFTADGLHVTRAAPILAWTVGKNVKTVLAYARGRGWLTEEVNGNDGREAVSQNQTAGSPTHEPAPSVSLFQVPQTSGAYNGGAGPSLPNGVQDNPHKQEVDSRPTRKGGE